jgi:hypothetical protein
MEQMFSDLPPAPKSARMRAVEAAHGGEDIRRLLVRLYTELGSQRAVARALGVSQATIGHWLAVLGVETAQFPDAWLARARPPTETPPP